MTAAWALAALWLGIALIASLLSIRLRISTVLSEIVVGTIAQLIIGAAIGAAVLGSDESWIKFLSGIGAIVLTFLACTKLDPALFKKKWKEATAVGLAIHERLIGSQSRPHHAACPVPGACRQMTTAISDPDGSRREIA